MDRGGGIALATARLTHVALDARRDKVADSISKELKSNKSAFSRRDPPEVLCQLPSKQRAWGMPGARRPRQHRSSTAETKVETGAHDAFGLFDIDECRAQPG